MPKYFDQLGREISLDHPPQRIVSLVPSLTELAVDLVGAERLVGCTSWCEHPAGLREQKTVIGGTKDVHLEKVRALNPDLILANKEENLPDQIEALAKEFPVWVSDVRSIEQALDLFLLFDAVLQSERGAILHREAKTLTEAMPEFKQKTVLYFIWKDPYMVAGPDTYINALLQIAGLQNLAPAQEQRYPSLSREEIESLNPELILLSSEPYAFTAGHTLDFWPDCPEVRVIDGARFTWYGSRLIKALQYLKKRPFS